MINEICMLALTAQKRGSGWEAGNMKVKADSKEERDFSRCLKVEEDMSGKVSSFWNFYRSFMYYQPINLSALLALFSSCLWNHNKSIFAAAAARRHVFQCILVLSTCTTEIRKWLMLAVLHSIIHAAVTHLTLYSGICDIDNNIKEKIKLYQEYW